MFFLGLRLTASNLVARWGGRGRLALAGLLLAALGALETALLRADGGRHDPADLYVVYHLLVTLNFLLPAGTLLAVLTAVGGGRDEGSLVYLLVRPCPRSALAAGLTLGSAAAPALFASALAALTCVPLGAMPAAFPPLLPVLCLGSLTYSALYTALVLWCRRTTTALFVGAAHLVLWEGFVANLPGTVRDYTVTTNLRLFLDGLSPLAPWPRRLLLPDVHLLRPPLAAGLFLVGVGLLGFACAWYRLLSRDAPGRPTP